MINSAKDYPISQIFDIETKVVYKIPRYQREYSWSRTEWESLIDDILDNDPGYYLGSIICINPSTDSLGIQELELVDGQQRLLTFSILLAALYSHLKSKESDDDIQIETINIRRKLILKNTENQLRVIPQTQNHNYDDYISLLSSIGIYPNTPILPYAGNRRVYRAYSYFSDRLKKLDEENGNSISSLIDLIEKLNRATLVKIEVSSHADAYTLFESLNTRGKPLTAVDLIKNKLLARMEVTMPGRIGDAFDQWIILLDYLGDDYATQERFFRQYYNAYRQELKHIISVPVATRSNLMQIYERLIDDNPQGFLKRIVEVGKTYSILLDPERNYVPTKLIKPLKDLDRIQGTPSYLLMLYLIDRRSEMQITDAHLVSIIQTLTRLFIRRHLTDTPPTRDLTRIFIDMIEHINGRNGDVLMDYIKGYLISISPSDEVFRSKLEGPIYRENSGVTRFVLCNLAEKAMTTETMTDLWARSGNNFVWTIEHILPQGENIPDSWVQMIADGDSEKAREIQQNSVHCLGNLTITGFNSTLGNRSFEEKRDRKDRNGRFVGYRNGLSLNADLLEVETWGEVQIIRRTDKLVRQILELYRM